VFKLGSASRILGVDFRRFQVSDSRSEAQAGLAVAKGGVGRLDSSQPSPRRPYTIRLHSDAVIASLTGGVGQDGNDNEEGQAARNRMTMAPRQALRGGPASGRAPTPAVVQVHDLIRG